MAFTPRNPAFEAVVRESYARQNFMLYLGAEMAEIAPGRCELQLKGRPELTQQNGFMHGGVVQHLRTWRTAMRHLPCSKPAPIF